MAGDRSAALVPRSRGGSGGCSCRSPEHRDGADAWSGICPGSPSAPYGRPERALHPLHTTTLAPKTGQDADGCSFQSLDTVHPGRASTKGGGEPESGTGCVDRAAGTVVGMKSKSADGSEPMARIAQAQGMVSVQADCTLDAALALLRNTARATDETVDHIAGEVVQRHVRFE
jgi:hypothetical protein